MRQLGLSLLYVCGTVDALRVLVAVSDGDRHSSQYSEHVVSRGSLHPLQSLARIMALSSPESGFQAIVPHHSSARSMLGSFQMAAIPDGGNVLCFGAGPVLALAAKKAALAGYKISVIAGKQTDLLQKLLYDAGEEELPNLNLLASADSDTPEFQALLAKTDGIIIASDADTAAPDRVLDIFLSGGSVKRVVVMSRNLNGKGMTATSGFAKKLANRDVWDLSTKAEYERFEGKLKSVCAASGADYVICRAGTLKGGGPADNNPDYAETKRSGLTSEFYKLGAQDVANWRMLFDCSMQGVSLLAGDEAEGPGFFAINAAQAYDLRLGDTGRHGIAGAMVYALGHGSGNRDFAVLSAEGKEPPGAAAWEALFAKLD